MPQPMTRSSGSSRFNRHQGDEDPAFFRTLICDKITASYGLSGCDLCSYVRERTGAGQHIDLSMLDSGLFFVFPDGFESLCLIPITSRARC